MINCEALNAHYISTKFGKKIKTVSLKEYSSEVILIDEKKLTSAAYNALYAIEFSTQNKHFDNIYF